MIFEIYFSFNRVSFSEKNYGKKRIRRKQRTNYLLGKNNGKNRERPVHKMHKSGKLLLKKNHFYLSSCLLSTKSIVTSSFVNKSTSKKLLLEYPSIAAKTLYGAFFIKAL